MAATDSSVRDAYGWVITHRAALETALSSA